ncbi:MAG: alanyl-tRNA editing protein [Haloferacaceae archaeon]
MTGTEPLYLDDTTRRTFEATVTRRLDDRVVLDRTCFYPTGGGQPHDTGVLRAADGTEWRVTDVRKRDAVYHALDGDAPLPAEGDAVVGEVDWERRYGHMRHHTAQHLLSAVLLSEYDASTTGNQVYADRARLDCDHPRFDDADLGAIEERLNDLVVASLPVRWYELDRGTAEADLDPARTRIELLPDSITEVRIVEIGPADAPFDRTACAGTHVENTAELESVTVTGRETRGPDGERLRFALDG